MNKIIVLMLIFLILLSGCSYVEKYNAVVQPPKNNTQNLTPVVQDQIQSCKVLLENGTEQIKYGDDCNIVIKIN